MNFKRVAAAALALVGVLAVALYRAPHDDELLFEADDDDIARNRVRHSYLAAEQQMRAKLKSEKEQEAFRLQVLDDQAPTTTPQATPIPRIQEENAIRSWLAHYSVASDHHSGLRANMTHNLLSKILQVQRLKGESYATAAVATSSRERRITPKDQRDVAVMEAENQLRDWKRSEGIKLNWDESDYQKLRPKHGSNLVTEKQAELAIHLKNRMIRDDERIQQAVRDIVSLGIKSHLNKALPIDQHQQDPTLRALMGGSSGMKTWLQKQNDSPF